MRRDDSLYLIIHQKTAFIFLFQESSIKPSILETIPEQRTDGRDQAMDPQQKTRLKAAFKTTLKKFGPLMFTGLVAVVEHHWLKHGDDEEEEAHSEREHRRARSRESRRDRKHLEDDRPSDSRDRRLEEPVDQIERNGKRTEQELCREARRDSAALLELKDEVSRLRKSIEVQGREELHKAERFLDIHPPPPPSHPANLWVPQFEAANPYREQYPAPGIFDRQRDFPAQHENPVYYPLPPRVPSPPSSRDLERGRRHRRSHRRRHVSVPPRVRDGDRELRRGRYPPEVVHAGKVAVIAGLIETIHVGDYPGDWVGAKGVRVGTAAAAAYGASYARERDRDDEGVRGREVVADVGAGLVVNRLVHGSVRRLEGRDRESEGGRERRRWSFHY